MKFTELFLLVLVVICITINLPASAVDNPTFLVRIVGTPDTENTFNGQNTIVLDWQILANREGLTLRYAQGLRLAYDNAVLQLLTWDGSDVIADNELDIIFSPIPKVACVGEFDTDFLVFAAQNATGELAYLNYLLGSPYDAYSCPQGSYVSLGQVRLAFRAGKSTNDLTADSIRCMVVSELAATSQSTAILLNTDENNLTSYEYLKQSDGVVIGSDTLNAPAITYPQGSTVSEDTNQSSAEESEYTQNDMPTGPAEENIPNSKTPASGGSLTTEETPASREPYNPLDTPTTSDMAYLNEPESEKSWTLVTLIGGWVTIALLVIIITAILLRKLTTKSGENSKNRRKEDMP